jgi:hypothetical protein
MSAPFDKRFPFVAAEIREFISSGDDGLGFASAWLLNSVRDILALDDRVQQMKPEDALRKEVYREAGTALIELRESFEEYERAIKHRVDEQRVTLH